MEIRYVPILDQVADILTKGLSRDRFLFLCQKPGLKVSPIYDDSSGDAGLPENKCSIFMEPDLKGSVEASKV